MTKSTLLTLSIVACLSTMPSFGLAQDDMPVTPDSSVAGVPDPATAPKTDSVRTWHNSFATASQIAVRDKRQMLLVFETEWCQWCKAMNDSTWIDPQVLSFAKGIMFVKVDADLDSSTVQRFHVGRFPTAILTTELGIEVDRFVGYFPPEKFREELTRAMEGEATVWEYEQVLKERNDGHVMVKMAREYIERGEPGKSLEFLLRARSVDFDGNLGILDDAMFVEAMIERGDRSCWYKSLAILKKLVKDHPKSEWREDAELYIPWLLAQAGDEKEAIRQYNEYLTNYGSSTEIQWVKRQIAKLEAEEAARTAAPSDPEGQ